MPEYTPWWREDCRVPRPEAPLEGAWQRIDALVLRHRPGWGLAPSARFDGTRRSPVPRFAVLSRARRRRVCPGIGPSPRRAPCGWCASLQQASTDAVELREHSRSTQGPQAALPALVLELGHELRRRVCTAHNPPARPRCRAAPRPRPGTLGGMHRGARIHPDVLRRVAGQTVGLAERARAAPAPSPPPTAGCAPPSPRSALIGRRSASSSAMPRLPRPRYLLPDVQARVALRTDAARNQPHRALLPQPPLTLAAHAPRPTPSVKRLASEPLSDRVVASSSSAATAPPGRPVSSTRTFRQNAGFCCRQPTAY